LERRVDKAKTSKASADHRDTVRRFSGLAEVRATTLADHRFQGYVGVFVRAPGEMGGPRRALIGDVPFHTLHARTYHQIDHRVLVSNGQDRGGNEAMAQPYRRNSQAD
jgi:hypothetical protein